MGTGCPQASQSRRTVPVNVSELELNFVAFVSAAMHQLSNGGDQPWLERWRHLLPDSEEEFMDVLETANVLQRMSSLWTRSLLRRRAMIRMLKTSQSGRTTMLRKNKNRRTKWQRNYSLLIAGLHIKPRPKEPPTPATCKWLALRLVHGAASAKDLARARGHQSTIVEAPAPVVEYMQSAPTSSFVASRSEILFQLLLSSLAEKS